jgi:transcription antitermination factor NusG
MISTDLTKKWYVLYTNPRAEKKVAQTLSEKGYEVYLPLQTTLKQWSDRKKKVEEPLFKSYLFIYANHEQDHLGILQVQGVMKFVRIGKEIISVRQQQIDAIKLLLATGSDMEVSNASYEIGDAVEIFAGPLKGLNGNIVKQLGTRNFSVSLEQLGTSLLITVPANYLREQ